MMRILRIIAYPVMALFVCLLAALGIYERAISTPTAGTGSKPVTIESGESIDRISERLATDGLIGSTFFFKAYLWASGAEKKIQAGEYLLPTGKNLKEIAKLLSSGKISELTILIREGETAAEIAAGFEKSGLFAAADFNRSARELLSRAKSDCGDGSAWCEFVSVTPPVGGGGAPIEGSLFPDTYRFSRQTAPAQAIGKLIANFNLKLTQALRSEIKKQGKNLYQVIIMASILEREVRTETDMKIAAGIFWRRLASGQALQSDATLSYILDDKVSAHSEADLEYDSPYNTYRYPGLPPGPIGNPGLTSIKAAINPTASSYNFFLTGKDGKTIFSKTFEEHKQNKAKYLK